MNRPFIVGGDFNLNSSGLEGPATVYFLVSDEIIDLASLVEVHEVRCARIGLWFSRLLVSGVDG